jgi:hypothetical protein
LRDNGSITLTDQTGTLLGTATAVENDAAESSAPAPVDGSGLNTCIFDFSVPNVPDTPTFYTVTTALGKTSFSHAEMVASHWRADEKITSSPS